MPDNFIRNRDGSFSKVVVGSNRTIVGCTLPLGDAVGIEVKKAEKWWAALAIEEFALSLNKLRS